MEMNEGRYCAKCGFDNEGYKPPAHHIKPGTILNNRYYVGKAIGEGGFGITYVGFDINLEIKTAIKEYFPKGCASRNAAISNSIVPNEDKTEKFARGREKFISEARILVQLDNISGVVSVKDFFKENDTAYIVMEFVEGQTLKEYLKSHGGRISADEAVELLKPIIKAMAQVHRAGIIHRDISPENIMITPSGSAKLIDFGSVRLGEDKSSAVQLKPGYAPPEQYSSKGNQGTWTDVYALCATLYRAVTGMTPTASIERMKGAALKTPSEAGAYISPIRDRAIMIGLELDPKVRFNNMDALGNALGVEAARGRQINKTAAKNVNDMSERSVDNNAEGDTNDITPKSAQGNAAVKEKATLTPIFVAVIAVLCALLIALLVLIAVFAVKGNTAERKDNTSEAIVYTENGAASATPTPASTAIPTPEFEHISASSTRGSDTTSGKVINYYIDYIRDGDYTTAWSSDRNIEITPTVRFSSETKQHVTGIKIANGYFKSEETYRKNRRITKILITYEGGSQEATLKTDSYRVMQDIRLNTPVDTSFVSIKVLESLSGEWKDIAISEISIY